MQTVALIAVLFVFCPLLLRAQPNGNEKETIRQIVNGIQSGIADKTHQIAEQPNNVRLFRERGALYVELYRTLYKGGYLSRFYGIILPELGVLVIASNAIADLSRAILLAPEPADYAKRGEMYAVRWYAAINRLDWNDESKRFAVSSEWSDFFQPTEETERLILMKFANLPDFAAARIDYQKALQLAPNAKEAENTHQKLSQLYLARAQQISGKIYYRSKAGLIERHAENLVLSDISTGIEHLAQSNPGDEKTWLLPSADWFAVDRPPMRYALYYKADMFFAYGKLDEALEALNAAEKYVDKTDLNDNFICDFYPFRSRLLSRKGLYNAALADASVSRQYGIDPPAICYNAYEPRGDAFFGKGDFRSAIVDYTKQIELFRDTPDLSALYKKRALAYLKTGEPLKAIADFTSSFEGHTSPEDYLLRAQAYRQAGEPTKAADDENRAAELGESIRLNTANRRVYGKLVLPDDIPAMFENSHIMLIYAEGEKEFWTDKPNERGHFSFYALKPRPFYLFAYFDTQKDGVPVRYYARTAVIKPEDKMENPVILKLTDFVQRSHRPAK